MLRCFIACLLLLLTVITAPAQTSLLQWHHLDPAADHALGISTERAYALPRQ